MFYTISKESNENNHGLVWLKVIGTSDCHFCEHSSADESMNLTAVLFDNFGGNIDDNMFRQDGDLTQQKCWTTSPVKVPSDLKHIWRGLFWECFSQWTVVTEIWSHSKMMMIFSQICRGCQTHPDWFQSNDIITSPNCWESHQNKTPRGHDTFDTIDFLDFAENVIKIPLINRSASTTKTSGISWSLTFWGQDDGNQAR
jgi:hypothetical protein